MNNGLDITEDEFIELTGKQQNLILFKNLRKIRKAEKDYEFHKKIQYVWLTVLTTLLGARRFLPI